MTTRPLFFGCLTRIGLAVAIVALCRAACADLPKDPFQRTAIRALRGDFGKLQEWQREGYQRGLDQGATATYRFHATYYKLQGHGRSEEPVSTRMAASNRLPQWSWVWLPNVGIRQVLDTGAKWNDTLADRAGCDSWCDLWFPCTAAAHRAGVTGRCAVTGAVIGK